MTYADCPKLSIARTSYSSPDSNGYTPEPGVQTRNAITIPEGEGLVFLDSILLLAAHQYFPILSDNNVVVQASNDMMQLAAILRTWRQQTYNESTSLSKAIMGILSRITYDEYASWASVRSLFLCVSTFKPRDFENLLRVRYICCIFLLSAVLSLFSICRKLAQSCGHASTY